MHPEPIALVLLWIMLIFGIALCSRIVANFYKQPGVLGELIGGIIVGNLGYLLGIKLFIILRAGPDVFAVMAALRDNLSLQDAVKIAIPDPKYAIEILHLINSHNGTDFIKISYLLDTFSHIGIIFLLFLVGLESSVAELRHTGREAITVALIGIAVPMILGFFITLWLLPNPSFNAALFIAATLSATSIGITARVLAEMHQLHSREAKTILGAAMLDDVLGLVILAVISSIIITGKLDLAASIKIIIATVIFFTGAISLGPWLLRNAIILLNSIQAWEARLFISFLFLMLLSWIATCFNLSSIIGAFTAGLIIHDNYFELEKHTQYKLDIKTLIAPLAAILAPFFFILVGIQVKLEAFLNWRVVAMAIALTLVAVIGKLASGWGGNRKDDRILIGIGMLPRGEVGLIFASIGKTLGVVTESLFSAIVLMIIITTVITPPMLKSRLNQRSGMRV